MPCTPCTDAYISLELSLAGAAVAALILPPPFNLITLIPALISVADKAQQFVRCTAEKCQWDVSSIQPNLDNLQAELDVMKAAQDSACLDPSQIPNWVSLAQAAQNGRVAIAGWFGYDPNDFFPPDNA
jgi:hypothetical protein